MTLVRECLMCGAPLLRREPEPQLGREGWKLHRERETCTDACRQRLYRKRQKESKRSLLAIELATAEAPLMRQRVDELEKECDRLHAKLFHVQFELSHAQFELSQERRMGDFAEERIASGERLLALKEEQLGRKDEDIAALKAALRTAGFDPEVILPSLDT